jgi:hypothetical protein
VVREELHMVHFAHLSHAVLATTVSYVLREILGKVMGNIWGIYQQHLEIIILYIKIEVLEKYTRFWKLSILPDSGNHHFCSKYGSRTLQDTLETNLR